MEIRPEQQKKAWPTLVEDKNLVHNYCKLNTGLQVSGKGL